MIRDLVLDAQTTEPAVRQVDLNLPAEQPLRTDGKNVADDEHPDHQHRVNRRAAARRVVRCKFSTHPGQIEHGGDLAHKVIAWYHLVEPKLVEKLLLLVLQPPHHRSPPQRIVSERRNHRSQKPSTGFCNKIGTSRTREMFALSLQSVPKQRLIGQDTTMGDRHRGRPRPMMPLESALAPSPSTPTE